MEEGRNNLVFAINGVRFEVLKIDPSTTMLEFIRTQTRYKGTKPSCGEGSFAMVQNLFGLLFGSISKEATNVACSDNPSSDSREVEKTSTDIGACPKTVNVQDLKQPMAFLLSAVAETGLVSLPSLLTAVLDITLGLAVTGVLKVLNNLALLDITLLQGMLLSQVLESRIEKMRSTYTLGVRAMKELNDTLQKKSSSNLEQIKSTFYAQTKAVENFMSTAVSEYEVIIRDIKNSLDEQKQVVTLSAQQQEEGLQRSLVSAQVISEATTDFFNDLCHHSSIFLTTIEQNSNKVDSSRKHWEDAQLGINHLIKCSTAEIDSIVADKCSGNQVAFENFVSVSSSTDAEFNSRACDLLTTVNGFWRIMLLLWWSLYHLNTLPLFQLMYLLMCFGVTWIPVYF
ncbi:hypothetical protein GIB67_026395 [Kingdonia uniflora]|uniref:Uncharacterized protein n=1 Tax=Kingdonia uniflora TaxID=39325 RepID=A0A7J7P630_9MAGN|nr:hypothetical protein GIB67_026395 [Kingdonia uniflora]